MMNPDQLYALRQLQHQDLRAETERARAERDCVGVQTPGARARLAIWLRRFSIQRATLTRPVR
jgi:hypothetical protein